MRIDRFTQKMQEALQAAQDVASQFNHQEITNEHFLSALLDESDGITQPLLEKSGVPANRVRERLTGEVERRPRVSGAAGGIRLSSELRSVLDGAERDRSQPGREISDARKIWTRSARAGAPRQD